MHYFLQFKGLVGLVTGGASGLGRATAERLIKEGGKVVICDLPSSKGHELSKEIGHNALFVPVDVSLIFIQSWTSWTSLENVHQYIIIYFSQPLK